MRFSVYGLLCLALMGCSGQNVVAGDEKTKSEQLEAALPSFCSSICTRLQACPQDCVCDGDVCSCSGVDADCDAGCQDFFAPYVGHGEACATVGQRLKSCIGKLTCDDLSGRNPCDVTDEEQAMCPDPEGTDNAPSSGTGGSTDVSGSNPGVSGGTVGPAVVSCREGGGAGSAPPISGTLVICEEQRTSCNDGHDYSWICAQDSAGLRGCTCFQDQTVVGAFAPVADCPSLSEVNAGCHWALTQ